jgi:uncharacterized protein (TIGR00266 family)
VKYEIRYKPAFATLFITLNPGERLTAEAGAMLSMAAALSINTQFSGGLIPGLLKKFLGGESLFVNEFRNSTAQPLELVLSQSMPGDLAFVELKGNSLCFQPGAYLAHTAGVNLGVEWAGFSSWLSGEGLFRLKVSGRGLVFFGGYGGISERQVNQSLIVDSGHLLAYEPGIKMNLRLAGGLLGSVTSGEGIVNRLTGQGKIYLQSRSTSGLVRFLRSKV